MSVADELEDLLIQERELVLAGRTRRLEAIVEKKKTLFDSIVTSPSNDPDQLGRIRTMASRNALLLAAANRGVKAAIRQISEAGQQSKQGVYDLNGKRRTLVTRTEHLEKKF